MAGWPDRAKRHRRAPSTRKNEYLGHNGAMICRTLGTTGIDASVIGVGTWQFSGERGVTFTERDVDAIFGAAQEEGFTLIDPAEWYGDHFSQALIGVGTRFEPDRWIIATYRA